VALGCATNPSLRARPPLRSLGEIVAILLVDTKEVSTMADGNGK
jgi:hypothetical protein